MDTIKIIGMLNQNTGNKESAAGIIWYFEQVLKLSITRPNPDATLEQVQAFVEMLTGKGGLDTDVTPPKQPSLSEKQAFDIVLELQETFGILPVNFDQCPQCIVIYDNDGDGVIVGEYDNGPFYRDLGIARETVEKYESMPFCDTECEINFLRKKEAQGENKRDGRKTRV
jgi:hypothetical protein